MRFAEAFYPSKMFLHVQYNYYTCITVIDDDSDEEPFEVGADGKIRLRAGKKKIDLSKLTDDDLRKLGIDPSLSKKEIAKLLKVIMTGDK